MGAVYEAIDKSVGAHVALKTLRDVGPEALLHLKNEFRSMQDLRHKHLVDLFELFEADGRWFFTMALVEGEDFLSYVRPGASELALSGVSETVLVSRTPESQVERELRAASSAEARAPSGMGFDEARLRRTFAQLALGLCALHDAGKAHRDIKPSNVLVNREGNVVLVDFGLAVELSANGISGQGGAAGTRAFMAPEQASGKRVTHAADVFSADVMLYLALTGVLPFHGSGLARDRAQGALRPILSLNPAAPPDLSELCHALLQTEPNARPSAREILRRLGHEAEVAVALPSSLFVGREAELSGLLQAWQASREHAVIALIEGDSGVGKSMLARRLLGEVAAIAPNTVVLSGRCYERELVPYKAFDGVIDALSDFLRQLEPREASRLIPRDSAILARIFPVLRRVAAFAAEPGPSHEPPAEQRAHAFVALRKLLFAVADERPLLVYIDDLQWADADSLLLLGELLGAEHAPRVCVIATARSNHPGLAPISNALARSLDVRPLKLAPLTKTDAQTLAAELLGPRTDARLCEAIVHEAAGHPLFLVALAHYAGIAGERDFGRVKLDDALWARIESMDAEARSLLELVAVAGAPLLEATLARASGLDPVGFAQNLRALRTSHLARSTSNAGSGQVEPYHDRIRETVVARLPASTLRTLHAELATALAATGEAEREPQSLVRHLEGAGELEKAAEQAARAAAHAASVLAFDRAAELYQTALRLGSFDAAHAQSLRLELASSLTNAGRGPEAADEYLRCVPGAPPEKRLEYRRIAADQLLRSAHLERGTSVLSDLLAEIGETFPRGTRFALWGALYQRLRIRLRGLRYELQEEARISAETLLRLDIYHTISAALSLVDTRRASIFQSRSLLLALETGEPKRLAQALIMESVYVAAPSAEGLARARELSAQVGVLLEHRNDARVRAGHRLNHGFLEYHAGNFRLSAQNFLESERMHRETALGTYHEQAVCRTYRLLTLRLSGQFVELWRGLAETTRDARRRSDRFLEAGLSLTVNQAWLAQDQPEEALHRIEQSTFQQSTAAYTFQHWYEELARADLELYLGHALEHLPRYRQAFRKMTRTYVYTVRLHRILAWHALGRLLVASAKKAADPGPLLAEASKLATRIDAFGLGYGRAYASLLEGAVARQRGEVATARRALEQAIKLADEAGTEQYAAAARYRLGAMVGGIEGQALLDDARVWLRRQDIRNPERMLEVWAPGFA